MALTAQQKRRFRQLGHHLKPVVIVGQAGLTEAVQHEIDLALNHHELLKVRINAGDRGERQSMIARLCQQLNADLVNTIGHIALIYRRNPDKLRVDATPGRPRSRKAHS